MRYMLLCRFDEDAWNALPDGERKTIMASYHRVLDDLTASGRHVASGQLEPRSAARTVRRRRGRLLVTDGPFMETKEHLGGYHVVECASMDEALGIAASIPTLPAGGAVEVRALLP